MVSISWGQWIQLKIILFKLQFSEVCPDISNYNVLQEKPNKIETLSIKRSVWVKINHGFLHYSNVIMDVMASQITSLTIVYSLTVYSGADQRKHQSLTSLAFVLGIHRSPVNSSHKRPVTRKMFPFDDVIIFYVKSFKHCLECTFNWLSITCDCIWWLIYRRQ